MAHEPIPGADLVLEHGRWMRGLARALVRDEHDREDALQDTWVAALEERMRHRAAPRAWLARVFANFARQQRRRDGALREREERAARPDLDETDPVRLLLRAELLQRIGAAVLALEEPYRSTLLLRYLEELSTDEIAARLGVPGSTVRNRIRRGLVALRERLDAEHGGDRRAWAALLVSAARGSLWKPIAITAGVWTMTKTTTIAVSAGIALLVAGLAWRGLGRIDGPRAHQPAVGSTGELAAVDRASEEHELEAIAAAAPDVRAAALAREPEPELVGVVVLQGLGTPVPDLAVWIEKDPNATPAAAAEPREAARTDENGRFELAERPALNQLLVFRGEGFLERTFWAEELPQTPAEPFPAELFLVETLPLGVFELEVVGPDDMPFADTPVAVQPLVSLSRHPRAWTMKQDVEGRTDALGRCTLEGVPCSIALMVSIDGAFLEGPDLPSIDAETKLLRRRFVCRLPGSISGVVTRADGTPVAGLVDLDSDPYQPLQTWLDPEGRFSFEQVRAGKAWLSIAAAGVQAMEIEVPEGEHLALDPIVLPSALRVSGTVRSAFGLTPSDFMAELYRAGERLAGPLWLDEEARFSALVPPGPAVLRVVQVEAVQMNANGTLRHLVQREIGDVARVTIDAPAEELEVWIDSRVGALEGRIAGPGEDAQKVVLELLLPLRGTIDPMNLPDPRPYAQLLEVSDGRFHSQGLPPGTFDALVVVEGVGSALLSQVEIAAGRVTDVGTVELSAAGLGGTVRDASGLPVAGAVVVARPRSQHEQKALTDADGTYAFAALPQGVLRLRATKTGAGFSEEAKLVLGRNGATSDLELRPPARIRGRLILAGEPAPRAEVLLMRDRGPSSYAHESAVRTDAHGAFVFEDLLPDRYAVSHGALIFLVDLTDGESKEIELRESEPTIEVAVFHRGRPLASIRSLVLTPVEPGATFGSPLVGRVLGGNRVLVPPLTGRHVFAVTSEDHPEPGLVGRIVATDDLPRVLETSCGDLLVRSCDPLGPPPQVFLIELGEGESHPFLPQTLAGQRAQDGWRYPAVLHGALLRLEGSDEDGKWRRKEWRFPEEDEATVSWP